MKPRTPTDLDYYVAQILAGPGAPSHQVAAKLEAVLEQPLDFVKRLAKNAEDEEQRRMKQHTKTFKGSGA